MMAQLVERLMMGFGTGASDHDIDRMLQIGASFSKHQSLIILISNNSSMAGSHGRVGTRAAECHAHSQIRPNPEAAFGVDGRGD
jgi:hypothetical protein